MLRASRQRCSSTEHPLQGGDVQLAEVPAGDGVEAKG